MHNRIADTGFAFVSADELHALLQKTGNLSDWDAFAASWNNLAVDTFMADKGRYRRRRYGVYKADADGQIQRDVHQPHFQTTDYNRVNGGMDRWFEPITVETGISHSLNTVLRFCHDLFGGFLTDVSAWHIEVHQFRIEAHPHSEGKPTPEGMHRDGVDYVLVLMIRRHNIDSGVTTIHDLDHKELGSFTLTQPFDAAIVDDARVYHGVTAVTPLDPQHPSYRDVLVVTFRRQ